MVKRLFIQFLKLFLFWIFIFDFQKILFSIHNWDKFSGISFSEYLGAYFYSFKLDLGTAGALSVLPAIFLAIRLINNQKWIKSAFYIILMFEAIFVALIHSGEINAYGEWNHKLTSRVFMHLSNPDEVFRTADYSMTFWYVVYLIIEIVFAWKLMKWLFALKESIQLKKWYFSAPSALFSFLIFGAVSFLLLRGGFQQIPMNINAATYSNNPVANDLSVNSLYFFGKSYMLYNRTDIDEYMPSIDPEKAKQITASLLDYPKKHDHYFLKSDRPNVVVIVLEGWAAEEHITEAMDL